MAIDVDPFLNPRIATVPETDGTQISMQDLGDELKEWAQQPQNLTFPNPITASGKQDLGSGVLVGITNQLENTRLAFEQRPISVANGYCTNTDIRGTNLIDANADFSTLEAGAWIINITDQSVSTIYRVVSNTEVEMYRLEDGTNNQWANNDVYKIWQPAECEASGGNLVAVAANGSQINAFMPTWGTHVVRTSSASATLQEQQDIRFASFNGGVTVDITTSFSGTEFPTGTPRQPVNNMSDALTIANNRGLNKLFLNTSVTVGGSLNFSQKIFEGLSRTLVTVTLDTSANTLNCEFLGCSVEGTLDGASEIILSNIGELNYINGVVKECTIDGPITLGGNSSFEAIFIDTNSGVAGTNTPIIDMGGNGPDLQMRGHSGGIQLENKTGSNPATIELEQGQIRIQPSVNNGIVVCRGIGKVVDNSGVGATIIDEMVSANSITYAIYSAQTEDHKVPGSFGARFGKLLTKIQNLYFK